MTFRQCRRSTSEVPLYVNDAYIDHYNKPVRARLRGLVRNPAIPADLLRRLIGEQLKEIMYVLISRKNWTDDQFEAVATHSNQGVREALAKAVHITAEQRATLVEDSALAVLRALAEGPDPFLAWTWTPQPVLPTWAYHRLLERDPRLGLFLADNPWLPQDLRDRLRPANSLQASADEPAPDPREAEAQAGADSEWTRARAAGGVVHPKAGWFAGVCVR